VKNNTNIGGNILLIPKFDIWIEGEEESGRVFSEVNYDKIPVKIHNILCERDTELRGTEEITIKLVKV